jgi:hypothetical protein
MNSKLTRRDFVNAAVGGVGSAASLTFAGNYPQTEYDEVEGLFPFSHFRQEPAIAFRCEPRFLN